MAPDRCGADPGYRRRISFCNSGQLFHPLALQPAILASIWHDQRDDEADGHHKAHIIIERALDTGLFEPERNIFSRAAKKRIAQRVRKANAERADLWRKHFSLHQSADRCVEANDCQRCNDECACRGWIFRGTDSRENWHCHDHRDGCEQAHRGAPANFVGQYPE